MPKMKFSAKGVQAIKTPVAGRVEYADNGLILRVAQAGTKTWSLRYYFQGRYFRLKLGSYPHVSLADARDKAAEALRLVGRGTNPAQEKKEGRAADTFGALAEKFLADRAENRTVKEYRRILEKYFHDWNNIKAHALTPREIVARMDRELKRGDAHARKCFAVLHAMYNFGKGKFIIESNPLHGLKRPGKIRRRDRVLSPEEIRRFWKAIADEELTMAGMFKLRLLTAQRGGEILAIERSEVDFETGVWTIPALKAKNGIEHRVPLSSQALIVIRELFTLSADTRWLFPARYEQANETHIEHVQKAIQRVRERAGGDWTGHDLRRTAATHMASIGVPEEVVKKVINHKAQGVTSIYNRYGYDREKRQALQNWADEVDRILARKENTIVVMPLKVELELLDAKRSC